MSFTPSHTTLLRYADVLVNFALGNGKGIKRGDCVLIVVSEEAYPLLKALREVITTSGGNYIHWYLPHDEARDLAAPSLYKHANKQQLSFTPHAFYKGLVDQADHVIYVASHTDPTIHKGIDSRKVMAHAEARLALREYYRAKEAQGKLTWTIGFYGTEVSAKLARMSLKEYWQQITKGCLLDKKDPSASWKALYKEIKYYQRALDKLHIDRLHVEGPDADLWLTIGEKRAWRAGSGNNIPSFEIFTSPDWRGTEGFIRFNQPLSKFGKLVEGIELEFKRGKVVKAKARKNADVLHAMLKVKNADKVGEFSLTDSRFSKITKFMANTLYDENVGGKHGNTHIALGNAYQDCYEGEYTKVKPATWERLGYNESVEHTDIISTAPRTVTAYLPNGDEQVIYKNGKFTL